MTTYQNRPRRVKPRGSRIAPTLDHPREARALPGQMPLPFANQKRYPSASDARGRLVRVSALVDKGAESITLRYIATFAR